jgi:ribosomal protein S27AE
LVKLTAKKIYCPKCGKLARIKAQPSGDKNQFVCIKCESVIWKRDGIRWKYVKAE